MRCECCARINPFCQQCGAQLKGELLCADGYHYCSCECFARHRDAVFCSAKHSKDLEHDPETVLEDEAIEQKREEEYARDQAKNQE